VAPALGAPVPVRFTEGVTRGFPVQGDLVHRRLIFRFNDGSLSDEGVTFLQRGETQRYNVRDKADGERAPSRSSRASSRCGLTPYNGWGTRPAGPSATPFARSRACSPRCSCPTSRTSPAGFSRATPPGLPALRGPSLLHGPHLAHRPGLTTWRLRPPPDPPTFEAPRFCRGPSRSGRRSAASEWLSPRLRRPPRGPRRRQLACRLRECGRGSW